MTIEEVIHRAVVLRLTIEIQYCTRRGNVYSFHINNIMYSRRYGSMYIEAFCLEVEEDRTFKISRIFAAKIEDVMNDSKDWIDVYMRSSHGSDNLAHKGRRGFQWI